jgi:hypothetical protein
VTSLQSRNTSQLSVGEERCWTRTAEKLPPEHIIVDTMISDIGGERNQQRLYRQGRLWFFPEGDMYVYYTPTHWSELV